jgi:hypothetical protein
MKCILCGSAKIFQLKLLNNTYSVLRCIDCDLEFCDPMPTDNVISQFYSSYSDFRASPIVVERNAKRLAAFLSNYSITGETKLLDYGCGKNKFAGIGENWYGFDPYVNTKDSIDNIDEDTWETIVMWGVLEHLRNPVVDLMFLDKHASKNAFLCLTTVVHDGEIPIQYKPPEHVTFWSTPSLLHLMDRLNYSVLYCQQYKMEQLSDVYLRCVLRLVPEKYRPGIQNCLPQYIVVPTNKVLLVAQKKN